MNGLERYGDGIDLPSHVVELAIFRGKAHEKNAEEEIRDAWAMALDEWEGLPVSPGVTQGTAMVHPGDKEVGAVRPGSILVCWSMAPALIELLPLCSGLVCEQGGVLNPTATTAREYGIPVVASAGRVTHSIQDGDTVRIDGTSGTVTVLSRAV